MNIDFVDEDVPLIDPLRLIQESQGILEQLNTLAGTYDLGRLARDGARVVIVGSPNAGKSSLFNALCKVCLLYTSPSPRDRQKSRMPSSA